MAIICKCMCKVNYDLSLTDNFLIDFFYIKLSVLTTKNAAHLVSQTDGVSLKTVLKRSSIFLFISFLMQSSLGSSQSCDRHTERRTGYIV